MHADYHKKTDTPNKIDDANQEKIVRLAFDIILKLATLERRREEFPVITFLIPCKESRKRSRISPMAPAKIDLIEVGRAMGDFRRVQFDYFLDVETGSVVKIPAGIVDALTDEGMDLDDFLDERDLQHQTSLDIDEDDDDEGAPQRKPRAERPAPEPAKHDDKMMELARDILVNNSPRYKRIPVLDRPSTMLIMQEFVKTVEDRRTKTDLDRALTSPQSFANFYRTINRDPKFRARWESFHVEMLRRYAYAWLQRAGIVPK